MHEHLKLLYFRLSEHNDNKKSVCYFTPRNEPKKVTEGYNIVLSKSFNFAN